MLRASAATVPVILCTVKRLKTCSRYHTWKGEARELSFRVVVVHPAGLAVALLGLLPVAPPRAGALAPVVPVNEGVPVTHTALACR